MSAETPRDYDPQLLDTLACDISARPRGAPHFDDVLPALRAMRREPGALVADFDPAFADTLTLVVDAERQCCAELGWHLKPADGVIRLRIEGSPDQLDAIATLFPESSATG
ncbi:MAG TPA: hypothetical protein VFX49_22935 [Chloroflexota bacterium]|nr:hypothetical protein [Chloroflexota bacterium]